MDQAAAAAAAPAAPATTHATFDFLQRIPAQEYVLPVQEAVEIAGDLEASGRPERRQRRAKLERNAMGSITQRPGESLREAVSAGDLEAVRQALAAKANVNARDDKLRAPIHFAATSGNIDILRLLIKNGADVNARDLLGNTALHLAACTSRADMITVLLEAGCDLLAPDGMGRTPLSFAESHLRLLRTQSTQPTAIYRNRVAEIVKMLHVFLTRSGRTAFVSDVDALASQLSRTTTHDEIDAVSDLLLGFTNLALSGP